MKKIGLRLAFIAAAFAAAVAAPGAAAAQTAKYIVVHNKTGTSISGVFFSESWSTSWGMNFITGYLFPNYEIRLDVASQTCVVDMRVTFVNGAAHDLRYNICSANHVDALPGGLVVAY